MKRHTVLVENPHLQSLAALVKLSKGYSKEELAKWLEFRDKFLSQFDKLVCVYCDRDDLVKDQPEELSKLLPNLATIDHVHPISKGGKKYDPDNCVVSCQKCNQNKADKII